MQNNQYYKNAALEALKGRWAPAVIVTIVFMAIVMAIVSPGCITEFFPLPVGWIMGIAGANMLLSYFVSIPLSVGYYNAFRLLYTQGDDRLTSNMFKLGFTNWLHNVWGMFLMCIKVLLWCLLLFIPGIIKAFAYAMTPFILVEHPEMRAIDAIRKSNAMMKGHKFDLFYLELSFIGWGILCLFTFGLGFIWLIPYMYTTIAAFYEDLKAECGETAIPQM